MQKKRVLIISYYWPPSGGAGVQRCLKYVKYLRDFGWEPVVFTAENAHYPVLDNSLVDDIPENVEVLKVPIWEPYQWYKQFVGMKKDQKVQAGFIAESKKTSYFQELAIWIRGNIFIPDARMFWVRPAVRFLRQYLKNHSIHAIVSSGPPHTAHLIARNIKRLYPDLHWVADFRDPWTTIDFYDQLKLTWLADYQHRRLEKSVLQEANKIVTVSRYCAKDLKEIGKRQINVISNGFDEDDFAFEAVPLSQKFTICHIGTLVKEAFPKQLWLALQNLCTRHPAFAEDLQVEFIGKTDYRIIETAADYGLQKCVKKTPYIPHKKVLQKTCSSQVLLLLINNTPQAMGITPGKMFEYLAARRPILCVAPIDGDAAHIIRETQAGKAIDYEAVTQMENVIWEYYEAYKKNNLHTQNAQIAAYSRKNLTGKLAKILDERIENKS